MTDSDPGVAVLERPAPPPAAPRRGLGGVVRFVAGSVPTLIVLSIAAGIGWWGHHHGWRLPKFSTLQGEVEVADDWCEAHKVPASICVECNPGLMPRGPEYGWCKVHGVPECPLEHPDVAQLPVTPVITQADRDRAARALAFAERPRNNPIDKSHLRRIQFASIADAEKAGVAVEPVRTGPVVESVLAPGEVGYDQTKVAHLSARAPGTVVRVYKHLGEQVAANDLLALVDAAEVGKAKAELLTAAADLRLKDKALASYTSAGGAVPEARVGEARAALVGAEVRVAAACQALTNLGLVIADDAARRLDLDRLKAKLQLLGVPARAAGDLGAAAGSTNLLPVVAPIAGTVTSRDVVAGEVVDATRVLFEVVDTRTLWVTFDLKGEDASRVHLGQAVTFAPDSGQAEVGGTIAYKSSQADPHTRTVKVRADLANQTGALPANTFGAGRVILREEPDAVLVPTSAIHSDGCCQVVFVRDKDYLKPGAPKVFHVRKVRTGAVAGDRTEIAVGLLPGELVATAGSGVMLTELMSGDLGAGCCVE